jgi:hypothetical protein
MVVEAFKTATSSLLVPTSTSTVSPIPTVTPNLPHYEKIGDAGTKTLWVRASTSASRHTSNYLQVVFVIMLLSSISFYAMAWRVPVVSDSLASSGSSTNFSPAKTPFPCHYCYDYYLCNYLILRHGKRRWKLILPYFGQRGSQARP